MDLYMAIDKKKGTSQEASQALRRLVASCEAGEAQPCSFAAMAYDKWGESLVTRDAEQSAKYFSKACEKDVGHSCWRLAEKYLRGDGVPQNHSRAAELYRRSLSLGGLSEDQRGIAEVSLAMFKVHGRIDVRDLDR